MILQKNLKLLVILVVFISCENRPLHDNSVVSPREIHEDIKFHFDEIMVDGVQYLILEKDNNNPHEGFGFMAFRANVMLEKQDTMLAYMRTITQMQTILYSRLYNQNMEQSEEFVQNLFDQNLQIELEEIYRLEKNDLSSELVGRANEDSVIIKE